MHEQGPAVTAAAWAERDARIQVRIQARILDIRWLLDTGTCPATVAQQFGVRPNSLARFLHRHGEHELARQFPRDRRRRAA